MSAPAFTWPELYTFPPFFTVQPADATRAKQLDQWASLVVAWHATFKQSIMSVREWPHWENAAIGRRLPESGIRLVMEQIVSRGNGEWVDEAHTSCRIFYRTPAEWGAHVLAWALDHGLEDTILTIFELHSGDIGRGSELAGLDPVVLLKALEVLEAQGSVQLIRDPGGAIDETGVKFKRRTR